MRGHIISRVSYKNKHEHEQPHAAVITMTSELCGFQFWILGDVASLTLHPSRRHFVLLTSTAAKKCALKNWKSTEPQKHWINELSSYCTPQKILHSVRRKLTEFEWTWIPL